MEVKPAAKSSYGTVFPPEAFVSVVLKAVTWKRREEGTGQSTEANKSAPVFLIKKHWSRWDFGCGYLHLEVSGSKYTFKSLRK